MVIFQYFGRVNFKGIGTFHNVTFQITFLPSLPMLSSHLSTYSCCYTSHWEIQNRYNWCWWFPVVPSLSVSLPSPFGNGWHQSVISNFSNLPLFLFPSTPPAIFYMWIIASLPICLPLWYIQRLIYHSQFIHIQQMLTICQALYHGLRKCDIKRSQSRWRNLCK